MTQKLYLLVLAGMMSFISFNLAAQQNTNYNRKEKKQRDGAINTKQKTPVKIIEYIVGTWEVDEVYKGKKEISDTDTLGADQTIEFDREGRYVSHSGNEKIDSGAYRLNEDHAILYLESESGDPIQEWNISFTKEGDMMIQPRENADRAEKFKYFYTRKKDNN